MIQMQEQKMRDELWVYETMEMYEYMEMTQEIEVGVKYQIVVKILAEMTAEFQMKKIQRLMEL